MSLTGPVDGEGAELSAGDRVGRTVDREVAQRPQMDAFDGGVSRRVVRRCRTAATILLATAVGSLLLIAVVPWGVISALMSITAAGTLIGSLLLLRRAALWSAVAASGVRGVTPAADGGAPSRPGTSSAGLLEQSALGTPATIGGPRLMSPGVASAPVKRRLKSAVVPIYTDDGPSPGGGGLVVHARADGTALTEGDKVLVWVAGRGGLTGLPTSSEGKRSTSSLRGRFVLYRGTDNAVFLATTWLTDTW